MRRKRIHAWLGVMVALGAFLAAANSPAEPLDSWHMSNPFPEGNFLGISHGKGMFVAVGEFGAIYTSSDGETWSARPSGTQHRLSDVAQGNNTFVAVGDMGTILISSDGVTWISRSSGVSDHLCGVIYGHNTFVAVGDHGTILTSPDGEAWTPGNSGSHQGLKRVAFGNNTFAAVGLNGVILTSPDGSLWTTATSGTFGCLEGIAHGNDTFVAVGDTILTSPDGRAWTERASRTNPRVSGIAHGSGIFAVVAENGMILTSPDGIVWEERDSGTHQNLSAVASGENRFAAAGENGALLLSDPLPVPRISVSATSLDFGTVDVGSSSSQNLTITNVGGANLTIRQMTTSGANAIDFIIQNNQCTGTSLPPDQNCTVQIVFSPHSAGSKNATLSISSNDPNTPTQTVSLSGSGSSSGIIFVSGSSGSACFISFSTFGSGLEKYLDLLREFRDLFLLESRWGKTFVNLYYAYSPFGIMVIARHEPLRALARIGVIPLVAISYVALYTSPFEKAILFLLLAAAMNAAWRLIRKPGKNRVNRSSPASTLGFT